MTKKNDKKQGKSCRQFNTWGRGVCCLARWHPGVFVCVCGWVGGWVSGCLWVGGWVGVWERECVCVSVCFVCEWERESARERERDWVSVCATTQFFRPSIFPYFLCQLNVQGFWMVYLMCSLIRFLAFWRNFPLIFFPFGSWLNKKSGTRPWWSFRGLFLYVPPPLSPTPLLPPSTPPFFSLRRCPSLFCVHARAVSPPPLLSLSLSLYIYIYIDVCVCVCV
jgi:hypothetical protein